MSEGCIITPGTHKWKTISILCGYDWCENCGAFREQSKQGDIIHIPHIIDLKATEILCEACTSVPANKATYHYCSQCFMDMSRK